MLLSTQVVVIAQLSDGVVVTQLSDGVVVIHSLVMKWWLHCYPWFKVCFPS